MPEPGDLNIQDILARSVKPATVEDLRRQGLKNVLVLNKESVKTLIAQAVEAAIERRSRDRVSDAIRLEAEKGKIEIEHMIGDHEKALANQALLVADRTRLERELAGMKDSLAERLRQIDAEKQKLVDASKAELDTLLACARDGANRLPELQARLRAFEEREAATLVRTEQTADQNRSLQARLDIAERERARMESEHARTEREVQEKLAPLQAAADEGRTLRERLAALEKAHAEALSVRAEALSARQEEIEYLRRTVAQREQTAAEAAAERARMEREVQEKLVPLQAAADEGRTLRERLAAVEQALRASEMAHAEALSARQEEIENLRRTVAQREQAAAIADGERTRLERELASLGPLKSEAEEARVLQERLKAAEEAKASARSASAARQEEVEYLRNVLRQREDAAAELERRVLDMAGSKGPDTAELEGLLDRLKAGITLELAHTIGASSRPPRDLEKVSAAVVSRHVSRAFEDPLRGDGVEPEIRRSMEPGRLNRIREKLQEQKDTKEPDRKEDRT